MKEEAKLHEKEIKDLQIYKDGTHLVTASTDKQVLPQSQNGMQAPLWTANSVHSVGAIEQQAMSSGAHVRCISQVFHRHPWSVPSPDCAECCI